MVAAPTPAQPVSHTPAPSTASAGSSSTTIPTTKKKASTAPKTVRAIRPILLSGGA